MNNQLAHEQLNHHLSFLAQDENNLTLLVKISDLYLELDDLDAAQKYLDKASTINRIACLGNQGLLHLNLGQLTQAQENFIEALNHEDTPALRYNLGFIYFINSDLESAAEVLSPLMNDKEHPEAMILMARVLHGLSNLEEAQALVKDVLTLYPDDSEGLGLLALLHFDMDEGELAQQAAHRALALNPDNYDAKLIDAMSRLATQEITAEEIEQLLHINPDDCRLWFALGNIHMTQSTFDLSEHSLKKAIEIYPQFYDCYIALGWCLLLQNKLNEAFDSYYTAANLIAELADSWGGLALVYALKEDFLKAEELIQKSKNLNSDCFLTEIAQSIYFNYKNPQKAKEHLVKALKSSQVSISEKLAFIIEDIQGSVQLH